MTARLFLVLATTLWGCATHSIRPDVSDVAAMAAMGPLPALTEATEGADAPITGEADASGRDPLTADRAVGLALLNNRELRARLREMGVLRGRLVQAARPANPVVELEILPERNSGQEVRIEYEISSLILAPLRARAAEAELEAERHRLAAEVVRLGFEVRAAFYDVQATEQRLAVARQVIETFALGREASEALREAGNVPPVRVAVEVAAHERAAAGLARLELDVIERREHLHRLLGLSGPSDAWRIDRGLPPLPAAFREVSAPEARALRASHELMAMERRVEAAGRRTRLARVEGWLPDVEVDVHALGAEPEGDSSDAWRFGGGVSVSVPLFDQGTGVTRAAAAERDALREREAGLRLAIRSEARAASRGAALAWGRAQRLSSLVAPAQREALAQTQLHYNAMERDVFDLLRARREALDVEIEVIDALHAYWRADAALSALLHGARVGSASADPSAEPVMRASQEEGGH